VAGSSPLRLAHRGDFRRAPENSLAAFAEALANPRCDGLELDVRVSADDVPVINHDPTLARVHGRPERVDELTAAALGAIGIPTLAEVLALAGSAPFLDVELKGDPGPGAVDVLAQGRGSGLDRAVVSSFDPPALERVGRLRRDWPCWLNSHVLDAPTVAQALALGCRGLAVDWRALDRRSVGLAKTAGLDVIAYTVRRRATFDRLARLGVVAVCVEAAALDGDDDA
jgi:glycerophosphoryl diester phosphodiesterase